LLSEAVEDKTADASVVLCRSAIFPLSPALEATLVHYAFVR